MKKKMISSLMALSLAGAAFGGVLNAAAEEVVESVSFSEDEEITLTIINHTDEESSIEWEDGVIERFMEKYPNVTVDVQRMSMDSYTQTIATKFASDDAPDLFYQDNVSIVDFIDNGYLADLTDTVAASRLIEGGADALSRDGRIYGLPISSNSFAVTYNKDAFAKAGIEAVPKTLSELYAVCDKLVEAGIYPFAHGYGESWVLNAELQTDFVNNLLVNEPEEIEKLISREKTFSGNDFWRGVLERQAKRTSYANPDPFGTDWTAACEMLISGEAAMIVNGDWVTNNCSAYGEVENFGAFALPVSDNPEDLVLASVSGGQGYCVTAGNPNEAVAKEFLNFMTEPENVKAFTEAVSNICIIKGADNSNSKGALADIQVVLEECAKPLDVSHANNFSNEQLTAFLNIVSEFLLNGGTDIDGTLEALDAEFDRIAEAM